jgi:serine/threonine protein kinase
MIGQSIAHYKITGKLGAGGMGEVYLATDSKLGRKVALKFLPEALRGDDESRSRLVREARAASRLTHKHIMTVYAVEDGGDHPFIVMEHLTGQSLRERIGHGRLAPRDAAVIALQIASALARAHQSGIVHRDLKPENIVLDADGDVKILDFGLALLQGAQRLTRDHSVLGTAAYMPPEQIRGESVDGRSDIWSLGVLLYEMIAGRVPFEGDYDQAVMYSILNDAPVRLSEVIPQCPKKLDEIVSHCLAKDPNARYADAALIVADLKEFVGGSQPVAPAETEAQTETRPSIGILPFANMSADPENEYFSDGLTEEIINALTKNRGLRIAARTSAFSFKGKDVDIQEIGKKLHVDHVVEGSVRKAGDRLRITAQLIKVADGYHMWSERYDRKMDDIFAIQDEITAAIVEQLTGELLPKVHVTISRPGIKVEAHDLYLRGMFHLNRRTPEDMKIAIQHFEKAIGIAPESAQAYAGLSIAYSLSAYPGWEWMPINEGFPKAREAADAAIRADESSAEAWLARGFVASFWEWDWPQAEECHARAIELSPDNSLIYHSASEFMTLIDRPDDSIALQKKAVALDPLSIIVRSNLYRRYAYARRFADAEQGMVLLGEMVPEYTKLPIHQASINLMRACQGKYPDDRGQADWYRRVTDIDSNVPSWALIPIIHRDPEERRRIARELLDRLVPRRLTTTPTVQATLHLEAGDVEACYDWMQRAIDERDVTLLVYRTFPLYDSIRDNPRFMEIIRQTGNPYTPKYDWAAFARM